MAKGAVLVGALLLSLLGGGAALGATSLIVADPSVDAVRTRDGSLVLTVAASNPTGSMSILSIALDSRECSSTGKPVLEPMSSADVEFEITDCAVDLGSEAATLTATLVASTGQESSGGEVPLTLSVKDAATHGWSALWWFLVGFAALLAVVPPYLTWLAFPLGNAEKMARFHKADAWAILRKLWSPELVKKLPRDLPGISSDWNFKDTWASNVGLAGSIFTGILATAAPLEGLVGEENKSTLAVVAVASAVSVALIGSGPLWLSILKQRTRQNKGYAKHNTVAGVLAASFVVYFATIGLIATVVRVTVGLVPHSLVVVLGGSALLLLLVYAWKSIPQTLGLGAMEPGSEPVWVVQRGEAADHMFIVKKMELAVPEPGQPEFVPEAAAGLRPARQSTGPSAMP